MKNVRVNPPICLLTATVFLAGKSYAAGPPVPTDVSNPLAIVLLIIIIALMLIIGMLAYVLSGTAGVALNRFKEETKKRAGQAAIIATLCLFSTSLAAQPAAAVEAASANTSIAGLSSFSYYMLLSIIGLELVVILVMLFFVKTLLARPKVKPVEETIIYKEPYWKLWWQKINALKPVGEVGDTGHEYDGIRELDNKLPPWWLYGFYACIIFALVYLYRFQVVHSAPSSRQEYEIAMAKAELEKEEYLKTAASKVDENTVTFLGTAEDIGAGKNLFAASCAPCHGAEAQGSVGPNLTDDYWLHKGSIKDVFKTIKYGVPEKGMKSWKDDFSPVQIAQLASYIKSLHGTQPANAKEPQGERYQEEAVTETDSLSTDKKIALK